MINIESKTIGYTTKNNDKTKEDYPFFRRSIQYGTRAGTLMALYFIFLQYAGMQDVIGLKYLGYGILGVVLLLGLTDYDRYLQTGTTFKNGITYAAQIALIAAATMVLINGVTFLVGSNLTFSKYGMESTTFSELLMISGAIFLEIMVAALVFTFIALQFLKSRRDYKSE